jgi:acetyl esterase/lipase
MYNKDEQEKLLSQIQAKQETKHLHGLDILIKHIPDYDIDGDLDPRVKKTIESMPQNENQDDAEEVPIDLIRTLMGYDNFDISKGVETKDKTIIGRNGDIPLKIYSTKTSTAMPVMVFIHGGAFFGGSTKAVENACKYLSEQINGVVVSVDYRLCPEDKFPKGVHDCYDTIKWVYNNSEDLNIDKYTLGVAGDSAGGNFSAVCSIMDRDLKNNMIKFQALIYPGVNLSDKAIEDYNFDLSLYNIKHNHDLIKSTILALKQLPPVHQLYLEEGESRENPMVSPLWEEDLSGLAPALIVTAEYDSLRLEAESYARKLIRHGVDVQMIQYNGMDHAFMDKLGIYPQAQDLMDEVAKSFLGLTINEKLQ